ncbi:winged helix-turn-helix domain-containing protein [uncultured Paraglaciecola sp.]|uniref:nSTAND1 domain-containing NTPase n=1 Tax=uncultured Paraglaciecola sp. TaxID=1765024 RepID=UPI002595644D|nr:winged helix-turn-helix domain-containing protein [uncultured Paraglaciecola sp.]
MLKKGKDLFFLQDWQVNPSTNTLQRGEQTKQLEPKAMDVLLLLCNQQGNVLSADEIATQCWGGIDIGDNPVHKAVTQLRKALGDKASAPTYIETIRKRGYHIIAQLDFPLDEELKAEQSTWHDASPFPGLVPFSAKDAQVFFGRNEQIATLLEIISNQVTAKHAFTLILGPSGTGKSSLVNAGLLPRLASENGYNGIGVVSHTSIDFADISQERLFIDLASAMLDWDVNDHPVFDGLSAENLAEQLQNNIAVSIQQCVKALQGAQNGYGTSQFLLFIDRLEVLLSSPIFSDTERLTFLHLIEALTTSEAIIVVSACRNDFYPLVVNHPSLMANKGAGGHFDLLAPTRAELMQMIRLPAVAANLTWSTDKVTAIPLDQLLCDEAAHNPDALPMLQYTLQELYLQRNDADELQVSVYKALGGIEGAIGKKAEEVYQQLTPEHQNQFAYVLSLLVTLNLDSETITSCAARWSQLDSKAAKEFVQAMVDSRLFVSHLQNSEPCFSLAHEALLRRWNRASEWISDHQDSLLIKSRLQQQSERWLQEGKNSAYLLAKGKPLLEAQSLKQNKVFVLEANEHALIDASLKRLNLIHWFRRATFSLLCVLTVTAIWMSVKSYQAEALAQQKRLEAESLLGFMVGEFADKLRSVKRMDLLDGISNKALEYFSQQDDSYQDGGLFSLADNEQNFKAQFQHAQTLGAMGEVAYSRAKNDEAKQAFSSAKAILDKLYIEQPENMELLKTLGANAFWLGQLAYDQSDFDKAQPLFELYRNYSESINILEPNYVDGWVELYYAHSTLGSLYLKKQEYTLAKQAFEASLKLNNKAISRYPKDSIFRSDKADTLSWLATTEQHLGNLNNVLSLIQQGQTELEQMLESEPNNANILETLAFSYWQQGIMLDYLGQHSLAYSKTTRALMIIQRALEQDPANKQWGEKQLGIQVFQLLISSKLKDHTQLNNSDLSEMVDNILELTFSKPLLAIDMLHYYRINNLFSKSHGGKLFNFAEKFIQEQLIQNENDPQYISALAELRILEAYLATANNNFILKNNACQQAIVLLAPLVANSRNVEYLVPFSIAHSCLNTQNEIPDTLLSLEIAGIDAIHFTLTSQ